MTEIARPLTTLEALKIIQKVKKQIKDVDDDRIINHKAADHISVNHMQIYEWRQSLEKLEKYLQWSV